MDYPEAIKYLESLPDMERGRKTPGNPTMSLDSMKYLLRLIGDPQNDTKTIHITGSKGKGSTSTLIASILQSAGYETALFTSPHLHSYRERIAFGLQPVSEERFAHGVAQLAKILHENDGEGLGTLSTFGVLTALFFVLASQSSPKIDWQIVEVGLGGTTDATNVFERKELAVITPISIEHAQILGKTAALIAQNKGGIITSGTSVILSEQKDASVRGVIEAICREKNAVLVDVKEVATIKQVEHDLKSQCFNFECDSIQKTFALPFLGEHQLDNAATALVAVHELRKRGHHITEEAISKGLNNANLAGRFEVFLNDDQDAFGADSKIGAPFAFLIDGAHNEDSARALAIGIEQYFAPRRCILILALNADKDVKAFWRAIKHVCRGVVITRSDNPRSIAPQEIFELIKDDTQKMEIITAENAQIALQMAIARSTPETIVCAAGSLYLVAQVRAELLAKQSKDFQERIEPAIIPVHLKN